MGWADQVKNVRIKGGGHLTNEEIPVGFKKKLKQSFLKAWGDFKGVFVYMIIGVGIGAAIYGYLPEDLLARVAGPDNPFAVLVVALIGMPLYIRVESAIPIGLALLDKGASIGAVIALIKLKRLQRKTIIKRKIQNQKKEKGILAVSNGKVVTVK